MHLPSGKPKYVCWVDESGRGGTSRVGKRGRGVCNLYPKQHCLNTAMSAALHSDLYTALYVHQSLEETMFNVHRQKVLDECKWTPGEGRLRYIEARTFTNTSKLTERSLQIPMLPLMH